MKLDPCPELPDQESLPARPSLGSVLCIFVVLISAVALLAIFIGYGLTAAL